MKRLLPAALLSFLTACGGEPEEAGQKIWEGTCQVCHLNGLGGAPAIGNQRQWQPRLDKGKHTLIQHALQGFSGETGVMPAKGGNPSLSDEEVALAVEYMLSRVNP